MINGWGGSEGAGGAGGGMINFGKGGLANNSWQFKMGWSTKNLKGNR